jgi:hypothetical protein
MKNRNHIQNLIGPIELTDNQPLSQSRDGVSVRIAEVAYELYEQRGRIDGHDVEDWLKAEEIITGTAE